MKPLILYHDDMDGFACAWIAHKALGNNAEYIAVRYGSNPPKEAFSGRPIYIFDFSYDRDTLFSIHKNASFFILLDHHKTAINRCVGIENCFVDEENKRSGCIMVWEYFFPDKEPPWFIKYIDDRDRWQFNLKYSKEVNLVLECYDKDFEIWDKLIERNLLDVIEDGKVIKRYQDKLIKRILENVYYIQYDGYKIPIVNTPILASEVGEILAEENPFVLIWSRRQDKYKYELRSNPKGLDVTEIAKKYGGGGHKNASGFVTRHLIKEII